MATLRTPPGRAGRLRLRRSLAVAVRGAGLLERKLSILRAEHQRLVQAEQDAAAAWHELLREAETWLLRGLVVSGEHALDLAAAGLASADVTVDWTTSMGAHHPSEVSCTVPTRPASAASPGNTALINAEAAYRRAVSAAADHACNRAAARIVGAEVLSTRQRVRALQRHWIPRLQEALAHADLTLEQSEHEDAVRRRWAARLLDEDESHG
ncbi:V-type ATP synthase subunit D [Streptomyces camelliae]|uniref:V-type ATP synthase subunit D n=1 Tax=Streptomyces camelliae TaxID=3004093 RepID=A0ABY7NXH7_9ACTN|nr:V-type ATP synthase subunit D [Streptomyces sp. HUAS 2-6]WBO62187.1 V-type ATP synthase subunit D [Streptomyces sp. HUAS 2-6]